VLVPRRALCEFGRGRALSRDSFKGGDGVVGSQRGGPAAGDGGDFGVGAEDGDLFLREGPVSTLVTPEKEGMESILLLRDLGRKEGRKEG
jgi:hypothetical protein